MLRSYWLVRVMRETSTSVPCQRLRRLPTLQILTGIGCGLETLRSCAISYFSHKGAAKRAESLGRDPRKRIDGSIVPALRVTSSGTFVMLEYLLLLVSLRFAFFVYDETRVNHVEF